MARIRTIKPEFWDSPGTAQASLRARLFFIAMWNWADDWGIGTANPKQLIGFAFPNDDDVTVADFPRLRTEVAECYGVQWYEVEGRPYYCIPSWDNHQKNERRASRRNPTPDQGIPVDTETRGSSVQTRGGSPVGTGEQGNRGTGEQIHAHPPDARASAPKIASKQVDELFDSFWSVWPLKKGKQPARKAFEKAIKSGASLEQILAGVENYKREIGPSPDWSKVKYPQGWLNDARWEDETAPVVKPSNQPDPYRSSAPTCAEGAHRWLGDGTCMLCTERRQT
ncbi:MULTISPECIES: hypothetical protein [unclassified Microbacterium]|uniref:hypothetical protein n=1 Tax=unclassified Microbacterium TaxID=2609290 RepID=UPI00300FA643